MRKSILILLVGLQQFTYAQQARLDAFVRLPHILEVDMQSGMTTYTPVVATGLTFGYRNAFIDLGSFIGQNNAHGYFSYAAIALFSRQPEVHWTLVCNSFAEVTYLPARGELPGTWIKTIGISPVIVKTSPFGTFALALTLGAALDQQKVTLNSRVILNYALPLMRKKK